MRQHREKGKKKKVKENMKKRMKVNRKGKKRKKKDAVHIEFLLVSFDAYENESIYM